MRLDQQRPELRAAPLVAAGSQRAQRVAVIALPARNDVAALRLALLDEVLPRHLQRRLDRLRTAAHQVDVVEPHRRVGHRSEEHTSDLQSLMRISYDAFSCTK